VAEIPIYFLTGLTLVIKCFVTLLDSSCSAVLNWLRQYSLLINWSTGQILFHSTEHRGPAPSTSHRKDNSLLHPSEPLDWTPMTAPTPKSSTSVSLPQISLINAPAYMCAACLPGSEVLQLSLTREGTYGRAMHPDTSPAMDLTNGPEEYHKFADVSSKMKADTFPPHLSYDLKIRLKDGASPAWVHVLSVTLRIGSPSCLH
jgi:hypothetical protein